MGNPVPHKLRRAGERIVESLLIRLGLRDPLLPPRRLIDSVGGGDYKAVGSR